MEQITIIGNLVAEAKEITSNKGLAMVAFTVAVNSGFGNNKRTNYYEVVGVQTALTTYLTKGRKVCVISDSIITEGYTSKDGTIHGRVKLYAQRIELCGDYQQQGAALTENKGELFSTPF